MTIQVKSFSDLITFTRSSNATYFDSAGVLRTATSNVSRIDYNPSTLAARGMLVEEQRTNIALNSEDVSAWSAINSPTINTNVIASPDGNTTADGVTSTATNSNVTQQITITSSTNSYSVSVFIKNNNSSSTRIDVYIRAGTTINVSGQLTINWSALTTSTSGSVSNANFTLLANNWYRLSFVITDNNAASDNLRVQIFPDTSTGNKQIYLWGLQYEVAAFPTSYIKTTTASATRAADVARINSLSPWYNDREGTLFTESQQLATQTPELYPRIVQIDDGTVDNLITMIWRTDLNFLYGAVTTGGVNQTSAGTIGITQTNVNKIALAYATNNFASSVNGGSPSIDNTGTIPTSLIILRIGTPSYSSYLNGWIRRIVYYPRRLTNAELQAITT